jgi:anthranilate synthase/aminodeoxychorismate synthase-like glutamine amidotransferase
MILLLDNYDSFTYNLAQYLGQLQQRVEVRRNDQITLDQVAALRPERIVISPGPCTPREAGISVPLIRRFAGQIPILGVCLGHQAIGEAFGGRVVRAPKLMHGKTSEIRHDGRTIFRGLPSPFTATRYHSLIVERASLPRELEISAECDESADECSAALQRGTGAAAEPAGLKPGATRGTIMGLRWKKKGAAVEGVQFHPESVLTDSGLQLLRNFLAH